MTSRFSLPRRSMLQVSVLIPVALAGCVAIGPDMPSAGPNFTPQITYPVSYDMAWTKVVTALGANSIPIASSSKETGQIVTDYAPGSSTVGLINLSSRYKYTIFLIRAGARSTTINITVALESSAVNGGFHDVTSQNTGIVAGLRNALYQKLEPSLV